MKNRLDDVKAAAAEDEAAVDVTAVALEGQTEDVEAGNVSSESMRKFFADVESVKATIAYVRGRTSDVERLQDQAMNAVRREDTDRTSAELDEVLTDANRRCAEAKQLLARIKTETEELEKTGGKASEVRIRKNMHQTFTQKFVKAVRDYQQAQQAYKAKVKSKVARQVRIVKPEATTEEIDQAMKSGDPGAVFRAAILQPGQDPVAQAYAEVNAKYQDVLRLEESVRALHEMFQDMALLVDRQGEMLDQIEFSVESAANHVQGGVTNLKQAYVHRKNIRKQYFCLALIIIIIIVVILVMVTRN